MIGVLFACMLLAAFPAIASAGTPEVRGEWSLVVKTASNTIGGTALVTEEANPSGEFTGVNVLFAGQIPGTFSATLEGGKATVRMTTDPFGPIEEGVITSSSLAVEETPGSLALSGEGSLAFGTGAGSPATLVATRVRTYKQIEEQEQREKEEKEEKEARTNVRGEWSLTLEAGPEKLKGIAIISSLANATNEFASKSALFEGVLAGTFSGTLKGSEATVTITTEGNQALSIPPGSFTGEKIAVSPTADPTSMSGSGKFVVGGTELTGTLTATRTRSYPQIEAQETQERKAKEKTEQEAKEKAEGEAKEKAEGEAKEKVEGEAKEKTEQEARTKVAQEAKAKAEQEAKAKAEREAREKQEKEGAVVPALVSAEPTAKTLTAGRSGSLALELANHNAYAVEGHLTLTTQKAKKKAMSFGEASFTISAKASETVKIKLSSAARAYLTHHKTLSVSLAVSTNTSSGMHSVKTYTITLHAFGSGHHKG